MIITLIIITHHRIFSTIRKSKIDLVLIKNLIIIYQTKHINYSQNTLINEEIARTGQIRKKEESYKIKIVVTLSRRRSLSPSLSLSFWEWWVDFTTESSNSSDLYTEKS